MGAEPCGPAPREEGFVELKPGHGCDETDALAVVVAASGPCSCRCPGRGRCSGRWRWGSGCRCRSRRSWSCPWPACRSCPCCRSSRSSCRRACGQTTRRTGRCRAHRDARRWPCRALTCVVTCWPQLVGLTLPVIATSVAATANVVAAAATAIPVRILTPIAAPAPPNSFFMLPPGCIDLRNGIGAAVIGSRIRCSSCSISRSKSFMSDMSGGRNACLGRINHF